MLVISKSSQKKSFDLDMIGLNIFKYHIVSKDETSS